MAKQFWVNNYFIDVARNQIQHQQQATPLPPKALKVLEVLASRAGEVVSHDELMDLVWADSVVGPNTLQRSIAQLRKAFGDDSKQQAFIKTHAKQGYSLEANVRWEQSEVKAKTSQPAERQSKPLNPMAIACSAIALAALLLLWPTQVPFYDQVTPLTASDEQEFNASYSPDGNYMVFNRFIGQCESHLWAKDLRNNREVRLSDDPGHYSRLSWSADGSQLAFILQSSCLDDPEQMQQCWQLQTLDFAQAWNGEAANLLRYDCAKIKTTHPTWLNDGRIALLQYPEPDSNQPDLVIYDAISDQITRLSYQHQGRIYDLEYTRQKDLLATVTLEKNNEHIVRTLTVQGEVRSEAEIKRLDHHSVYENFRISFSPDGEHFLTDVEGQIYQLSINGELELIHPRGYTSLWSPIYHPNQDKFTVTLGYKDFDIGVFQNEQNEANIDVFARSTSAEVNAKFQPNGDLISFVSFRSGRPQVWLIDGDQTYQLTQFDDGLESTQYSWSPDGKTLAVNTNTRVAIVSLDGSFKIIDSPIAVNKLMPWHNPNLLLATDNQSDQHQLFSIDVNSGETTDLQIQNVLWAAHTYDNQILVSDQQKNFWLHSPQGRQPISKINKKLFGFYLLLKNEFLYGIDALDQLWRYDLKQDEITTLADTNKKIDYISDLRAGQMLATKFMGGRRELVEFGR